MISSQSKVVVVGVFVEVPVEMKALFRNHSERDRDSTMEEDREAGEPSGSSMVNAILSNYLVIVFLYAIEC